MSAGGPVAGPPPRASFAATLLRGLLVVALGLEVLWIVVVLAGSLQNPSFGLDYRWHMDAARRLLDTGTPYLPWQLTGPYVIGDGAILYPPIAFALFVPFLWLPAVLWWAVPMAVTVIAMVWHRPPLWAWVVTGALFCLDKSLNVYVFGNPSMWIVAAVAAGTVSAWPFALILVKPTFAPLALLGIRRRSWWVALAAMAGVSLVFGQMWLDWIAVVRYSDVSLLYNVPTLPLILAPLVPWVASGRPEPVRRVVRWLRAWSAPAGAVADPQDVPDGQPATTVRARTPR